MSKRFDTYKIKMVDKLYNEFKSGLYNNMQFLRVYKYSPDIIGNVQRFVEFINDENELIQIASIKLLYKFSEDFAFIKELNINEINNQLMSTLISCSMNRQDGIEWMSQFLSEDNIFLTDLILMFNRAHRAELFTLLLFSRNDELINYIKRVISNDR